jgi:hypothetical protein
LPEVIKTFTFKFKKQTASAEVRIYLNQQKRKNLMKEYSTFEGFYIGISAKLALAPVG